MSGINLTPAQRMELGLNHSYVVARKFDKKGKPIQHGASTSRNSYRPRTKQQIIDGAELQPISIQEHVNEE